jgi:hypothetical protein
MAAETAAVADVTEVAVVVAEEAVVVEILIPLNSSNA